MPVFERAQVPFIPVVTLKGDDQPPELQGALFHVDALKAYNRALAAISEEEHG
jgi:CIC family chloride channel protein